MNEVEEGKTEQTKVFLPYHRLQFLSWMKMSPVFYSFNEEVPEPAAIMWCYKTSDKAFKRVPELILPGLLSLCDDYLPTRFFRAMTAWLVRSDSESGMWDFTYDRKHVDTLLRDYAKAAGYRREAKKGGKLPVGTDLGYDYERAARDLNLRSKTIHPMNLKKFSSKDYDSSAEAKALRRKYPTWTGASKVLQVFFFLYNVYRGPQKDATFAASFLLVHNTTEMKKGRIVAIGSEKALSVTQADPKDVVDVVGDILKLGDSLTSSEMAVEIGIEDVFKCAGLVERYMEVTSLGDTESFRARKASKVLSSEDLVVISTRVVVKSLQSIPATSLFTELLDKGPLSVEELLRKTVIAEREKRDFSTKEPNLSYSELLDTTLTMNPLYNDLLEMKKARLEFETYVTAREAFTIGLEQVISSNPRKNWAPDKTEKFAATIASVVAMSTWRSFIGKSRTFLKLESRGSALPELAHSRVYSKLCNGNALTDDDAILIELFGHSMLEYPETESAEAELALANLEAEIGTSLDELIKSYRDVTRECSPLDGFYLDQVVTQRRNGRVVIVHSRLVDREKRANVPEYAVTFNQYQVGDEIFHFDHRLSKLGSVRKWFPQVMDVYSQHSAVCKVAGVRAQPSGAFLIASADCGKHLRDAIKRYGIWLEVQKTGARSWNFVPHFSLRSIEPSSEDVDIITFGGVKGGRLTRRESSHSYRMTVDDIYTMEDNIDAAELEDLLFVYPSWELPDYEGSSSHVSVNQVLTNKYRAAFQRVGIDSVKLQNLKSLKDIEDTRTKEERAGAADTTNASSTNEEGMGYATIDVSSTNGNEIEPYFECYPQNAESLSSINLIDSSEVYQLIRSGSSAASALRYGVRIIDVPDGFPTTTEMAVKPFLFLPEYVKFDFKVRFDALPERDRFNVLEGKITRHGHVSTGMVKPDALARTVVGDGTAFKKLEEFKFVEEKEEDEVTDDSFELLNEGEGEEVAASSGDEESDGSSTDSEFMDGGSNE